MAVRNMLCSALLCAASLAYSQSSPYFPEVGTAAVEQRLLDLSNPSVVLCIASEPGQEDLATLAALRLGTGARIAVVYITNGSATASDLNGDIPSRIAGRRKEEADRAMAWIGGDAHFLNFSDLGVVHDRKELEALWNRGAAVAKLASTIRSRRPDVILICRDMRYGTADTLRASVIRQLTFDAVAAAGSGSEPGGQWHVSRLFTEESLKGRKVSVDVDRKHPVWKRSYRDIAREPQGFYESLRLQLPYRERNRQFRYTLLLPQKGIAPAGVVDGLSPPPASLQQIARPVREVIELVRGGKGDRALRPLANAVAYIEQKYGNEHGTLGSREKQVLLGWKNALERLRCSLLGVEIDMSLSDSILAERQLFYLRPQTFKAKVSQSNTEILFPSAMNGSWGINGTTDSRFPFTVPSEFRLLTPGGMRANTPMVVHGLDAETTKTIFPVIVFHKDGNSEKNFEYRANYTFRIGPVRSAEIITPVVRVIPGERLVFSLLNISRDPFKGEVWVRDSIVNDSRVRVALTKKDDTIVDSLALDWNEDSPDGDHIIEFRIGKRPQGAFLARKFEALVDTTNLVGVVTGREGSPIEVALRRLGVPHVLLDSIAMASRAPDDLHTIVVDGEALALRRDGRGLARTLLAWTQQGGRLVVFPQIIANAYGVSVADSIAFDAGPALAPDSPVNPEAGGRLLMSPNPITEADWGQWIISRAQCSIRIGKGEEAVIHIRDGRTGNPLVATFRKGKGTITAVALDLIDQLQTVHAGSYRLFANLLAK